MKNKILIALILALLSILTITSLNSFFSSLNQQRESDPETHQSDASVFTVEEAPLTRQITLNGTINAGKTITIVAPIEGIIETVNKSIGSIVEKEETILKINTKEIENSLREAQAVLLKAEMGVETLKNWMKSSDVLRAQQSGHLQKPLVNLSVI